VRADVDVAEARHTLDNEQVVGRLGLERRISGPLDLDSASVDAFDDQKLVVGCVRVPPKKLHQEELVAS